MYFDDKLWLASDEGEKLYVLPKMANRHGVICGATGTGKTITLKVLAESFSDAGVPVFLADVKGDLAGMTNPGVDTEDMQKRIQRFGLAEAGFRYTNYPVSFWDIKGEAGMPLRTTISEFGPLLMSRLLELNQTQSNILDIVFSIADSENLLLLDIKDLRSMLNYVGDNAALYRERYGNFAKSSISAIVRSLTALEERGGDQFFGEPALDIRDWFRTDFSGRGMINIMDSRSLTGDSLIYSTFMLWMLSEIYERMPEAGDLMKPKMVFFFDEAHLLFKGCPKALLEKIEQIMKLIRSKAVGVYFITQNPSDIPDAVLAQLQNRVQHSLHAYTAAEQKAVRAAAESFRQNPDLDIKAAIQELGTGEAVVSFLQEDGTPMMARRAKILPPQSQMGPIDDAIRVGLVQTNTLYTKYSEMVDRESAYELLIERVERETREAEEARLEAEEAKLREKEEAAAAKEAAKEAERAEREAAREAERAEKEAAREAEKAEKAAAAKSKKTKQKINSVAGVAAGTIGREVGNTLGKTVGGTFGKKLGGNVGAALGRGLLKNLLGL